MKILLIGPDKDNSTDGVIIQGILHVLTHAYGDYEAHHLMLDDHSYMDRYAFAPKMEFDLVAVCGTPWLWHNFQMSHKYYNLLRCFKVHNYAPKIFLGAGSCLCVGDANTAILESPEETAGIKALFEFPGTTVITRDRLAQRKLESAGIATSTFLPCPSYFCYGIAPDRRLDGEENALVWIDPLQCISAVDWANPLKLERYHTLVKSFVQLYRAEVYCAKEEEVDSAMAIGLPAPKVLKSWNDTLDLGDRVQNMLSGRVHCAVPAAAQGKRVGIVPMDTRAQVLTNFGVRPANTVSDLNFTTINIDLGFAAEQYKRILQGVLK